MSVPNPKKIQVICEMSRSGKTNKEIAEHFVCSTGYISKILTENGIRHRAELPDDSVIIESYKRTLSSNKTADEFGINQKTVLKVLYRNNVSATGIQHYRLNAEKYSREIQQQMKELYEQGMSVLLLQEKFGGSSSSIRQAIARMGGELRDPGGKKPIDYTKEMQKEICELYLNSFSQVEIADRFKIDQTTVSRLLISNGIRIRKRNQYPKYKGGRTQHHEGYILIWMEPDDLLKAMRPRNGYVGEHRLVMARHLGRVLTSEETVHHINGNKEDNRLENLQLHRGRHGTGVKLQCVDCGSNNIETSKYNICLDCKSTKIKFSGF